MYKPEEKQNKTCQKLCRNDWQGGKKKIFYAERTAYAKVLEFYPGFRSSTNSEGDMML